MSGTNPFRRRATAEESSDAALQPFDHIPLSSNPSSGVPPIDTDIARHVKIKTSKTVRIISPHSAEQHEPIPDDFFQSPHRVHTSPLPDRTLPNGVEDTSPQDPFAADSEGVGSATEDESTQSHAQTDAGGPSDLRQPNSGMPSNPFKKTLASLEERKPTGIAPSSFEQSSTGSNNPQVKAQYDVDDFKRLLLTGDRSAPKINAVSAPTVNFGHSQSGDSSSNTDASSLSRQSILEPVATTRHESPQTSRDSSDDERQNLGLAAEPNSTKIKPSAPKPRHGRLMQATGPQTVSFEDPSLSTPRLDRAGPPTENEHDPVSSDLYGGKHKALPSLPSSSGTVDSGSSQHVARSEPDLEPKEIQANSAPQKKSAPTPPPTRRSRPMSISSINSGRSIPLSEDIATDSVQLSRSPPNKTSNAPAPPPPRRSKSVRTDSGFSIPTISSVDGESQQSIQRDQSPTSAQRPSTSVSSRQSPSSLASKGPSRTSPASMTPATVPPPPPPPRRRGSSQSSGNYTPSRLSGIYSMPNTERQRSDSGASSISQVPTKAIMPTGEYKSEQGDVMADLTALQREVDELRGKMR